MRKAGGLTDRQAEREATEQRLKEQYGDNPLALNNVMSEQKKTWAAEDQLRGSWMAGLKSGWSEWEESATDSMSQVKSAATQTFDGITQNMAAMLTGSEQNWRSFTRSVLSMMTEILLKQAMVGIVGSIGSAIGGGCWWRRIRVRRYSHSGRCGEIPFCNRRIYGNRRQI